MMKTMKSARIAMVCALSVGASVPAFAQTTEEAIDAAYGAAAGSELLPPNAKPGECYARVYIPESTKRVAEQVMVKEATEKLEVVPAVYETVEETVEIEGPSEELEIVPAVFKTEVKTIVVEPEREVKETVDAVYETVEEKVKVREAYTTWKKGEGPIQRYDEATGEIMCLVTIPAEYETVEKRVVKTPPRTVTKVIPAKTETVEVKIMVEPPTTRTVKVPAKTRTIAVQRLVTPASVKTIKIPAQYETVYRTVKENPGQMEWRPILCSTNASEDLIKRLQIALRDAGYNPGAIDGVLGGGTMEAIRRYQRANDLAQGQVTIETLNELGVSVR